MSVIPRKRLVGFLLALAMTVVLVLALTSAAAAGGPIIHSVHAGGPDSCTAAGLQPGCDANFSIVALEHADGSVSGQYIDRFAGGAGGFHATIDCLSVNGNQAWVSGTVTQGVVHTPNGDIDLAGLAVSTRVEDNGAGANDPADRISFSFLRSRFTCDQQPDSPLFEVPQGQVRVK